MLASFYENIYLEGGAYKLVCLAACKASVKTAFFTCWLSSALTLERNDRKEEVKCENAQILCKVDVGAD
jgi:hypothetical protein